ncbi:MAG: AAA family ATPase [Alphaproteobacteria bacterium]|nr:AAA family ATPase [Alphaproteobacteria bacterium]
MHFAKLRLSGFKSFVDPTELVIEPGMTGIVGPNGCGKSNILDAMRWVMGETSAKRLRGGEMDDVIFSGTSARPARNVAEVMLHLDNSAHDAPQPYEVHNEIQILRRIERGVGSDYRINSRDVRARDVQLLFADVATGANSSAILSQGRIGAIISAKPADRRMLLEEAAGIAGLHSRRHEAELRLKAAETNLTRLDDVLRTLETQLESLKKQARQAQRYRRLSDWIRRAEATVLHLRYAAVTGELTAAEERLRAAERVVAERMTAAAAADRLREAAAAELPPLRHVEAVASAELQRLTLARQALDDEERRIMAARQSAEARLKQLAADLKREDELAADARTALARLGEERQSLAVAQHDEQTAQAKAADDLAHAVEAVAALDAQLTALTERVAAEEARRAALATRIAEAGERQARLTERENEIVRQRAMLEAEAGASGVGPEAQAALKAAESAAVESRTALAAAEQALAEAQAAEAEARAPLEAAEMNRAKLKAESEALERLLAKPDQGQWPPVVDAIQVAHGFEAALGAALGDDLAAPTDPAAPTHWFGLPDYADAPPLPAGLARLSQHVTAPPALARRLNQIGIVETIAEGERFQPELRPGQRLVSRDGGLWRWDGFRRLPGAPTAATQRLEQRHRLNALSRELQGAEAQAAQLRVALDAAQHHNRERAAGDRHARQRAREALDALADIRNHEAELARAAAAIVSRRAALEEAAQRLQLDRAEAEADADAARTALAALPDPAKGRDEVQTARGALAERRALQQAHQGEHDRLVREAASRGERLAAIGVELMSWQQRAEAAARQRQTLEARRGELRAEIESLAKRPQEIAAERDKLAETIAGSTARRNQAADALAAGETKLAEADKAARAAEAAAGEAREERVRAEGGRDQAALARSTVAEAIAEKIQAKPDEVLAAVGIGPDEDLPDIGAATTRLERLLRERENMGPVNLVAEAESREIEERLAGLNREREDLVGAIAKLRQGIAALNREGRERLLAAFTQVNNHFGKLFARLFGGGSAHLRLDPGEDEDPLQAGLEIMASPPGKKLQNLTLLSGGEQALTALALLFAVFLTNPAPICVLDEVDAPLDDANVDRFCRLVAEIVESAETRFLIITHHRLTMARVDRLYGVTMTEKGVSQLVSVDLQGVEQLRRTA